MKRQGLAAVAVLVAIVLVAVLVLKRGGERGTTATPSTNDRVYVNDSLGVRLRLPDSAGWTLRRDTSVQSDGRIVTAAHAGDDATVRVVVLPATPDSKLEDVFRARQEQIAPAFGVDHLDKVIARVIRDETDEIRGRPFRQWQALTQPVEIPGEDPVSVVFMWLMTVQPERSIECIGIVRFPTKHTPEQQTAADALLHDVAYILQSFEVR